MEDSESSKTTQELRMSRIVDRIDQSVDRNVEGTNLVPMSSAELDDDGRPKRTGRPQESPLNDIREWVLKPVTANHKFWQLQCLYSDYLLWSRNVLDGICPCNNRMYRIWSIIFGMGSRSAWLDSWALGECFLCRHYILHFGSARWFLPLHESCLWEAAVHIYGYSEELSGWASSAVFERNRWTLNSGHHQIHPVTLACCRRFPISGSLA